MKRAPARRRPRKAKALSRDAWLERKQPVNPTQFVQIQPMQIPLPPMENREVVLQ